MVVQYPFITQFKISKSIIGPFEFEAINAFNRTRQKVSIEKWTLLYGTYMELGIMPPTFCSDTSMKSPVHDIQSHKRKLEVHECNIPEVKKK